MTVGESIITWLYGFGDIAPTDRIETDQLGGEAGSFGLFKEPTLEETVFIDGTRDVTAYYYILARQSNKSDAARIGNQAWMEALEGWVRAKNLARELPDLGGGRTCYAVGVSVASHMPESEENGTADYQLTVRINYTEG